MAGVECNLKSQTDDLGNHIPGVWSRGDNNKWTDKNISQTLEKQNWKCTSGIKTTSST